MSNVESNAVLLASSPGRVPVPPGRETLEGKARLARAFLMHLISREIQLGGHVSVWLRSTAQALAERSMAEVSADCLRLAAETWELREQLVALAHRLVARRNRGLSDRGLGHRRINVLSLLEQPPSPAMLAFIEFNQALLQSGPPGAVVAVVSAVEQLLTGVVPLAIDIAGFAAVADITGDDIGDDEDASDLAEVAEAYDARFVRAEALRRLTTTLTVTAAESGDAMRDAGDSAIAHYTQIIRESAELSRASSSMGDYLDGHRGSLC